MRQVIRVIKTPVTLLALLALVVFGGVWGFRNATAAIPARAPDPCVMTDVGGKLTIDFKSTPRMAGTLEHWQYDSFVTRFEDKAIEPADVTFGLDADGRVERVTMKAVSPLADFSYDYHDLLFTPVAGAGK